MGVGTTAYYDWKKRPRPVITSDLLRLYRRMKRLFEQSRNSLGSREMTKNLREEGFQIGRYRVRKLMRKLGLVVTQRVAYKVTTKQGVRRCSRQFAKSELQPGWPESNLGWRRNVFENR